ncbi:hypothetical protein LX36DRAFT_654059 [Colletotrichum falcatum]|nr:hypothetical protein LX36DRAFT_654059 [Colletotrichum falcatum]
MSDKLSGWRKSVDAEHGNVYSEYEVDLVLVIYSEPLLVYGNNSSYAMQACTHPRLVIILCPPCISSLYFTICSLLCPTLNPQSVCLDIAS